MAYAIDLTIDQGSNVEIIINASHSNGEPWDLSSYTVNSYMRKHPLANNYYSFEGVSYSNGLIQLTMNAEISSNIRSGYYMYDVEVISGSNTVSRVQEGLIFVNPGVTR